MRMRSNPRMFLVALTATPFGPAKRLRSSGLCPWYEGGEGAAGCVCPTNLRFFVHAILPMGGVPPPAVALPWP